MMNKKLRTMLCTLLLIALPAIAIAETNDKEENTYRPLFTALEINLGEASWIETPLSYLTYKGFNASINLEMMRAVKGESRWVQQHQLRYSLSKGTIAVSGQGGSWAHFGNYTFGMMHYSTVAPKFRLYYGFDLNAIGGVINNSHKGNNPFTTKWDVSVGFTGMAVYDFQLGKLPITARYQMSLPVFGIFSQQPWGYMASGLFDGFQLGSWNNHFNMRNRLHVDLRFDSWALRLGYNNDIMTHYATDNRFQYVTHNFVIGFAGELMRWSKKNNKTNIKSALYLH